MASKVAGIDVHKKVLMVVVMDAHAPESTLVRRRFTGPASSAGCTAA